MVQNIGTYYYYMKEGKLHREDGPAEIWPDGTKRWYKEGKLHRADGPAIEYPDGTKFWYKEGLRHRAEGPAIEWDDEQKIWWTEGKATPYNARQKKWPKVQILIKEYNYTATMAPLRIC
jgi:hypothetical protein